MTEGQTNTKRLLIWEHFLTFYWQRNDWKLLFQLLSSDKTQAMCSTNSVSRNRQFRLCWLLRGQNSSAEATHATGSESVTFGCYMCPVRGRRWWRRRSLLRRRGRNLRSRWEDRLRSDSWTSSRLWPEETARDLCPEPKSTVAHTLTHTRLLTVVMLIFVTWKHSR